MTIPEEHTPHAQSTGDHTVIQVGSLVSFATRQDTWREIVPRGIGKTDDHQQE